MRVPLLPGTGAGHGGAAARRTRLAALAGAERWTRSREARSSTACSSCTTSAPRRARPSRPSSSPPAGWGCARAPGSCGAIAELLAAALREQPARRIAAAAEVWREQPFAYPAGEQLPLLTGVIDVLAREQDGGYLVIDYKSDPVAEEDDLEALVARDYALQRELYALAVLRGGAQRVEVQHWFLERPQEWASARFEAAGSRLAAGVPRRSACGAPWRPASPSARRPHRGLCATCPGRARLCSWPESATMAPEPAPADGGG